MLALQDTRVLGLVPYPPVAMCTMMLGDFGAEVIKIEPTLSAKGHVPVFGISPKGEEGKTEASFNALNRNKKSIGLNLRTDEGMRIFYDLALSADVIVEGFRPGAVERLQINYEAIKKINPKIIYCSLSGYGQDGPYSHLPGHDINYIAMAGALGLMGPPEGSPAIPLNLLADFASASLHGVIGILTALAARTKMGKRQYVDIAYTDGVISLLNYFAIEYFREGLIPKRGATSTHGAYPYYGIYETKDNRSITIGCMEPHFWEKLCRALGKEEYIPYHYSPEHLIREPDGEKWNDIHASLKQTFLTRTRDEWFEFLASNDVPVGKMYTLDEVFTDPQGWG